jgi:hypothetical protein
MRKAGTASARDGCSTSVLTRYSRSADNAEPGALILSRLCANSGNSSIECYGISIARDFRFVPKQKSASLSQSPPWRAQTEGGTTTSLLDCPKSGKPTTRQINQRSLFCRCDHAGLRALRSTVDPGLDQFPGGFLTSRSGFAAWSGVPPPSHQIVLGEMLLQHR